MKHSAELAAREQQQNTIDIAPKIQAGILVGRRPEITETSSELVNPLC